MVLVHSHHSSKNNNYKDSLWTNRSALNNLRTKLEPSEYSRTVKERENQELMETKTELKEEWALETRNTPQLPWQLLSSVCLQVCNIRLKCDDIVSAVFIDCFSCSQVEKNK